MINKDKRDNFNKNINKLLINSINKYNHFNIKSFKLSPNIKDKSVIWGEFINNKYLKLFLGIIF